MTNQPPNPDITVRGGIINVPHSTSPTHPPRHQPNTPRTKKFTKTKPDHQVYEPEPEPQPQPADPQPSEVSNDEPTPPS